MGHRVATVTLLAIAGLLCSAQRAEAEDVTGIYYGTLGGVSVIAASVPFLVADVAYTVQGRWLPPEWAVGQISIGGGVNATVAAVGFLEPGCDRSCSKEIAIAATVLSVGFIAHGVASLVLYEPPPAAKPSGEVALRSQSYALRWVPEIVVTQDGHTLLTVSGVF